MPQYTEDDIRKALDEVNRGSSIAAAANKYGIPRTTLSGKHHHVYPVEIKKGPATILTTEEEKQLEIWIFHLSDAGFPVTPDQLLDSVQHLIKELKRQTPFTDGRPGRKWYKAFMRRHPEIKKKLSRNLSHPRTRVTQENIRNWFKEVRYYLTKENFLHVLNDPKRIFNTDETAFFLCPKGDHVLVRKTSKMVYNFVNNDDKECLTALIGGNAAGDLMPPMVVYPYQRVPAVVSEMFPKTWAIGRSENGWMTSETFYEYIANIFHPWLMKEKIKLPVILFVDGHSSHGTLHLSEFCQKNQIVLVALYPNSTHFLQPMDVACFHPLKNGWKKGVRKWRFEHEGGRLKREHFAPLLEKVLYDVLKPETIMNGFRKCGLHPFTPEAINFKDMMVKSVSTESTLNSNSNAHNEVQSGGDINYHLFANWINKSLSPKQLRDFRTSGEEWNGDIEHKSLFEFWHKHEHMIQSLNANANTDQSAISCDNSYISDPKVDISDDNITTLLYDFRCIPTVDLEGIELLPIEDIVVVENSQVERSVFMENENIPPNDHNDEVQESNTDHTDSESEVGENNSTAQYSDCSSSESETYDCNSSFYENPTFGEVSNSKDHSGEFNTAEDYTLIGEEIGSQSFSNSIVDTLSSDVSVQQVENVQLDNRNFPDTSHIPPNTPAAFAKVLFYPGVQHLSAKNKRSVKKRKLPSVYSSLQYSEMLREKEKEKEQFERQKLQRKVERERAKQIKETEKKEREAARIAKKEAVAVKNAEIAARKADAAMKKAELAAKKADEAAKKASSKVIDSLDVADLNRDTSVPQKKKRKIASSFDRHGGENNAFSG